MGTFENDAALDWVIDLAGADSDEPVRAALRATEAPGPEEYLDMDAANEALAAADVVAAMRGAGPADLPEEAARWLARHPAQPDGDLLALAHRAVRRVGESSELQEEWGDSPEWRAVLDDLLCRLGDG
jgi:hypothetical protein